MTTRASEQPKVGCLKRLLFGVCVVAALLLGLAVWLVGLPQDLSDVDGYREVDPRGRDLRQVLEQSVMRGHAVKLSEGEINRWLGREVRMKQAGLLAGHVESGRVWVRLNDGQAEVVMERRLFGVRTTLSMFVQVVVADTGDGVRKDAALHGGPYFTSFPGLLRGGRFGRLVVPQGYLYLVKPAFAALASACNEEIHLAFDEMSGIRIEDGQLVLDPQVTTNRGLLAE